MKIQAPGSDDVGVGDDAAAVAAWMCFVIAWIGNARRVGIDFKAVSLGLARIVAQGEGKDRGRMGLANIRIFLSQIVVPIEVIKRFQQCLYTVVSRCCWSGPWERRKRRTIRPSLYSKVDLNGANRDACHPNAEDQI